MANKLPKPPAPDLSTLRAKTDPRVVMRMRVLAQLAVLKARGPEAWQREVEFLREAKVGNQLVKFIRKEFDKFTANVNEIGKKSGYRVWFHDARVAGAFRAEQEKLRRISESTPDE